MTEFSNGASEHAIAQSAEVRKTAVREMRTFIAGLSGLPKDIALREANAYAAELEAWAKAEIRRLHLAAAPCGTEH